MTACAMCGYDADARVSSRWFLFIERDPPSLNDRIFNAGARRFAYRNERDLWHMHVRVERLRLKMPKASGKRRVTFIRFFGGRQQQRDLDNLVGGGKCVVDALVLEELLVADSPEYAELHWNQQRSDQVRGLRIIIEEIDGAS